MSGFLEVLERNEFKINLTRGNVLSFLRIHSITVHHVRGLSSCHGDRSMHVGAEVLL
jgi:hypothetical protein